MNELQHHGIKGQKWGIRRFQNKNGSLTPAGKERYDDDTSKEKSSLKEPKKRSKGKRVAIALVKEFGRDSVAGFASAALIKSGHEAAGKALAYGLGAYSYYKLGSELISIAKDKDDK